MRFFSKTYSWEFGDKKIKFPVPTKHYAIAHFPAYCKNLCVWGISKRVCRERTLPLPKSSVTVSLGRQQWIASFLFDCSIMLDVLLFNFFSLYLFPFYCVTLKSQWHQISTQPACHVPAIWPCSVRAPHCYMCQCSALWQEPDISFPSAAKRRIGTTSHTDCVPPHPGITAIDCGEKESAPRHHS